MQVDVRRDPWNSAWGGFAGAHVYQARITKDTIGPRSQSVHSQYMQTNYTFVELKTVLVVPQDPSAGEKCFGLLPAGVCINGSKSLDPSPGIC